MNEENSIVKEETAAVETLTNQNVPMGFEDDDTDDIIIPRVKIVQTLSPERKDKVAEEGDIINSLTKDKLNKKVFIPVFKYNNNIWWRDRADGGGINCTAKDGRHGVTSDGTNLICSACRKNEFDNTKQGREALPKCTKYINFFGFFAGERMPIILSFAKTNYNEGKKLYSLAKVSMQNMWNHGYELNEKVMAKNGNEWFIISATPNGVTGAEDREYALNLYKSFRNTIQDAVIDSEEETTEFKSAPVDVSATEF